MTLAYVHVVQLFTSIKRQSEESRKLHQLQVAVVRKYDVNCFTDADARVGPSLATPLFVLLMTVLAVKALIFIDYQISLIFRLFSIIEQS